MKSSRRLLSIAIGFFAIATVQADDRVYEDGGSVWSVSFIETKPGILMITLRI